MTQKYSLWLKPEGKILQELRDLIVKLAIKYGGPKFEPHVTYLGDLNLSRKDALNKAFQLSNQLRPFTIELSELGYTENYFRCVFIRAKKSKPLKQIAMPHLSLLYGNFPEDLKKKIIKSLGPLNFKLKISSVYLTNSSRFTKIENWQVIAEFPLGMVSTLNKGGVGVIPTDTIYGIVGAALNSNTVEKIYKLRKRTKNKPFIILISKLDDLKKFNIKLTTSQKNFLKKIWPNPVSIVLNNLAFRMPRDKWLLSLLEIVGPLVAPSANIEGQKPAENIKAAKKYFGKKVDFYLDGGVKKSKPSTLIKLNDQGSFDILRQGSYRV